MYIKDRLSVIERVYLRKNIQGNMFFVFFFFVFFFCFFCEVDFLGQNAPRGKIVFSNITYKEGSFYQKRSEVDLTALPQTPLTPKVAFIKSQLSLSRLRLSRITVYLEEKIWSLF